jgi:hypothetical protein
MMVDDYITITGLSLADQKIGDTGKRVIAHFNVEAFGIVIRNAKLIRTEKDDLSVTPPALGDARALERRSITFKGDLTRGGILKAAVRAYRALGGTDLPAGWNKLEVA